MINEKTMPQLFAAITNSNVKESELEIAIYDLGKHVNVQVDPFGIGFTLPSESEEHKYLEKLIEVKNRAKKKALGKILNPTLEKTRKPAKGKSTNNTQATK